MATIAPTSHPISAQPAEPAVATIAVAHGDGIGPEIMDATLRVLEAAGARLHCLPLELGEAVYRAGNSAGITAAGWETIAQAAAILKAPITTPLGSGYKSLNVTLRKTLGLYANIRPNRAYAPFVPTLHPRLDVVIVRENEEDLYAGIEHRQTDEVYQCLKLVSRPGCERIVRHAFEFARANGRHKVTCLTKSNIMKLTDGLFQQVFTEIGRSYPEIEQDHMIIDIGAARLAARPQDFDVVVTANLYGDIVSDIVAEVAGSVGLGASANIGANGAMFEAIHGSAPDIAGQGIANPSGLLLAGVMMLVHVGQNGPAERIHNAWLRTIEDGIHPADIYRADQSAELARTERFADAVIERLGQLPQQLEPVRYAAKPAAPALPTIAAPAAVPAIKALDGIDVFVCARTSPDTLAARLQAAVGSLVPLAMITNRGVKVWPAGHPDTFCTDHWRCRFQPAAGKAFNPAMTVELLRRLAAAGIEFVKTEQLYRFDGVPGYSLGQGQ
ncbi:MAG: NADP-dependent isocitrate dehydrogenase [Brevundimonas sp.]|jgi:isocitrate dehydrogenase|nr:NADP-dependent isocitrate dehydrogenase [Brevundimonas sp.]